MQQLLKNSLEFSYKIKYTLIKKADNSPLRYSPQRNKNISWHTDSYTNVYDIFIHNSPKVETCQISIDKWMNTEITVYPYDGILLSNKV